MKRFLPPLLAAFSLLVAFVSNGQTTAGWDFNGNVLTPSTTPSGATAGNFSVTGATGSATANLFRADNWTTAATINLGQYFEVTITPTGGNRMDFTSFVFDYNMTMSAPNQYALRSSVDGYAANLGAATGVNNSSGTANIDISSLSNQTGAVTFRIYGWEAVAAVGRFELDNVVITARIYNPTEPTQAHHLDLTATATSTEVRLFWTPGNGSTNYVVGNIGSAVAFTPTDGSSISATASLNITSGGSSLGGTDHLLAVGANGTTGILLTNLVVGTRYFFRVYEANGTGTQTNYNTATATYNPISSVQRTPSSNILTTTLTGTGLTLNWTNGTGASGRIVVAKAGSPVDDFPTDGSTYTANNDFSAAPELVVAGGNKVIASGSGPASITGLTAGTTYYFRVFEQNASDNYTLSRSTTRNPISVVSSVPATQALDVVATGTGTLGEMRLNWTNGSGNGGRLVLMKTGGAFVVGDYPVNSTTYVGNQAFGSAPVIGSARVVYSEASGGTGGATGITITGLGNNNTYTIKVLEFDGTAGSESYNLADGASNNPVTRTTPNGTAPGTSPTNITFTAGTTTSISFGWTAGNGNGGRVIVIRPTTALVAADEPLDGVSYVGNSDWSLAPTIGPNGAKVVYNDAVAGATQLQGPITISNLTNGVTYHIKVFDFSGTAGTGAENYRPNAAAGNPASRTTTVATTPATQALDVVPSGSNTAGNMILRWTNGSGNGGRVVVMKPNSPFTVADEPVNGASYNGTLNFNTSPAVGPNGAKVVYREASGGTGGTTGITVTTLGNNVFYYIKVFEFDGALGTGEESYMVADGATLNPVSRRSVLSPEANDATTIVFGAPGSTSIPITSWVNGTSYAGLAVTGASGNGATATLTFAAQTSPPFPVGSVIRIASVNPGAYNAASAVVTASTTTSVSYASAAVAAYVSGGTITTGGRLLLVKPLANMAGTDHPTDGNSYSYAGLNYGSGTAIGGAGSRVVYIEDYSGTGSAGVTVTGLTPSTSYRFFVVEYSGALGTGAENYNVTGGGGNAATGQTISTVAGAPPTTQAIDITFTPTTSATTLQFGWTNGNGANGRIAIIKAGAIVPGDYPVNAVGYTGNQDFALAPTLGGARVIYSDAVVGTIQPTAPITVTNLTPNTTYHVKVFEFNGGAGSENYQTADGASGNPNNATTHIQPIATYGVSAGTVGNAAITADMTISFNIPVRFTGGAAISTDAEIKQFVHLVDNTTLAAIPFTATINAGKDLITITPANSNITGNTLTGSRDYNVSIDATEIESNQGVILGASNQVVIATTLAEPNNQPTAPTTASTITSVTLGWTDDGAGAQLPENYLVVGVENGMGFPAVTDATDPAVDLDFSDGTIIAKVAHGTAPAQLLLTTGVKSGQPYDFRIYSYTNEAAAINFNTTTPLTASVATATGSETFVENGAGSGTVSSIVNDLAAATAASANFTFDVNDDGLVGTNGVDNAPTRVTGFTIHRSGLDGTGDWTSVIGGVLITDGTNSLNSFATPASFSINADDIIVTGVPAALGLVGDNTTKTFQVKLWLRTDTGPLNIDGMVFGFSIDDSDFTVAAVNSSNFAMTGTAAATATIAVVATHLSYVTQPTNTSINVAMSPAVTVRATDVNLNRDFGFTSNISITSSGTLSGSPVSVAAVSGISTFSTLTHTATGAARQLTAAAGLPGGSVNSANFNITASDIIVKAGYVYPQDIDYINYQDAVLINGGGSIEVAQFTIRDGFINGPDGDLLGTTLTSLTLGISNSAFIQRIAIFNSADVKVGEQAGAASVTFPLLAITAADGGSIDFKIRVSFTTAVVDNQNVGFTITGVSGTGSTFVNGSAGGAATSTAGGDNRISVDATQFVFTTAPTASIFAGIPFPSPLTLEARDPNGRLDVDYTTSVNVSNAGGIPMTDAAGHTSVTNFNVPFVGGVLALNSQLRYDHRGAGNGTLTIADLTPGISLTSAGITVNVSNTSDIIENTGFTYPTDFSYLPYNAANINPVSAGDELAVAEFYLRDGGSVVNDPDGVGTELTSLTFTLTNSSFINRLALYNGATELGEVAVSGPSVTFPAFSLIAPDDNKTTQLRLYATFNTVITDKQQISFQVFNATVNSIRSLLPTGTSGNAGAAISSTSPLARNRVNVIATDLDYTSIPLAGTNVFISADFAVTVQARDINDNLDIDFIDNVTSITNAGGLLTNPSPATSGPFAAGVKNFTFKYLTAGNGTLTMNTPSIAGEVSPPITVTASATSTVFLTGTYSTRINYILHQQTVDPLNFVLATFRLNDGAPGDTDSAPTVLDQIQFTLSNPTYVKMVGVYDAGGTLIGSLQAGSGSMTFSSLGITAADEGFTTFTIRASFESTTITDEQNIQLVLTGATAGVGSNFLVGGGLVGGSILANRTTPSAGANITDVIATQLVYVQQPQSIAGTLQPFPVTGTQVRLEARDVNSRLDTEFDNATTVSFSALAGVQAFAHPFLNGVADIDRNNLRYLQEGVGTLTATSTNHPPTVGIVAPGVSTLVNVYEVRANLSMGGVSTSPNLAGGSVNKVIYGVTFRTNHVTAGEPKLRSFNINFITSAPIVLSDVLQNVRVYEQINNVNYVPGSPNITTFGGVPTINDANTSIEVNLTAQPRDFSIGGGRTYTYFVEVDIDPLANSLTPSIEPYIEDLNWNNALLPSAGFDPTNANIVISPLNGANQGGGRASVANTRLGYDYTFAAIFPPKLISSSPAKGSINVNPAGNISLTFDVPVYSLDLKVKLYRNASVGSPGIFITDLNLVGTAGNSQANINQTLTFGPLPGIGGVGSLNYSDLLYITVAPVNAGQTTGIRDLTGNKFAGISSPGTVYFRLSSNQPPLLLNGPSAAVPLVTQINNISLQGATIQTTFDKPGTAYWVLTNTAAPRPTRAQILGLGNNAAGITGVAYPSSLTRGSFPISQIQPAGSYGQINFALTNGVQYKVWMFAANSDLPTAFPSSGAYDDTFTAVPDLAAANSTFTFTASNPGGVGLIVQAPSITICTGGTQQVLNPIRIVERNNNDLLATGAGVQTFNLVLPPGYIFDVSQPGVVALSGSDFASTTGTTEFLSSSIVQIKYSNNGTSASLDNITITNLYITATGTGTGQMFKLGGSLTALADITTPIAVLTTTTVTPIGLSFNNSSTGPVSFLPDEITTPVGHPQFAVQLQPVLPPNDFGPSTFSGDGVTIDSLHVNAVTVGQPFLITMTHTDFNGCVSIAELQYLVYDHETGLGIASEHCISPQYSPTPLDPTVFNVLYDAFPGFYLTNLTTSPVADGGFLQSLGPVPPVTTLPNQLLPGFNPGNNPKPGPPPTLYYNFDFDVETIHDGTLWYNYSYIRATGLGNRFYTGGTLGSVEFRGLYQSIANTALSDVPLVQNSEMFAPALPYIEVFGNLQSMPTGVKFDPLGSGNMAPLHPSIGMSGHPGTYLFCEFSGDITFEAFPRASAVADGVYALYDYSVPATPVAIPLLAAYFSDQNNGTATLKPDFLTAAQAPADRYKEILVTYTYKDDASPCTSIARMVIQITPNPVSSFTRSAISCVGVPVNFTDTSTIPGSPTFSVAEWAWDFGDVNSGALNTDANQNPSHIYGTPQLYSGISLTTKSAVGCPSIIPATTSIDVGGTPIVNYTFTGVSTGDTFQFTAAGSSTVNDDFAQLIWTFNSPTTAPPVTYMTQAEYTSTPSLTTYALPGTYVTDLEVVSTFGCRAKYSDTHPNAVARTIVVVGTAVATNTTAYEAHFETTGDGWIPWYASTPTNPIIFDPNPDVATPAPTWVHNGPDRTRIKRDAAITGTAFWATDSLTKVLLPGMGHHSPRERSALYSPAFDLSGLLAPMISYNAFSDLGPSDGLIVEYSQDNKNIADPTKEWIVLGKNIGEGVDWFTDRGIAAKPGAQVGNDFGWTNTSTAWIEPKHTLDTIQTTGPNTNVVLRFSLASLTTWSPDFDKEGFAIDNVRIGDRTRTILLESFANVGNENQLEMAMNDSIRDFPRSVVGTKVVKINYHMNFPKNDPFNLDNATDPSSRASYYGITTTPKSRLDGANDPLDRPFISWAYGSYGKRSLQLAQAELTIIPTVNTGDISIMIDVDAKFDLPANTILHVAVLEDLVNINSLSSSQAAMVLSGESDFNWVLKKLLPTASGTKFGALLANGDSRSFGPFTYTPNSPLYSAPGDLRIVAFLQKEDGDHEIYQVSDSTGFADPSVITGLEPIPAELVQVYPNPAHRDMTVQLPAVLSKPANVRLIDQTGRSVLSATMPEGSDRKTINVSDLSGGMYILTIDMGQGMLTRKKVMVVHQD